MLRSTSRGIRSRPRVSLLALLVLPAVGLASPSPSDPIQLDPIVIQPATGDTADGLAELTAEAALASIRAERIRGDLEFLADDLLQGRDSPSPGLRIAARYIRSRVARLGFTPGGDPEFFQSYPVNVPGLDPERTHVTLTLPSGPRELVWGADYFLPMGRMSGRGIVDVVVQGDVVYCGAGERDQLAAAELEGRWALCLDEGQRLSKLRKAAQRAGAVGLLLTPGPEYTGEPYAKRFRVAMDLLRRGPARLPDPEREPREVYPVVALSGAPDLGLSGRAEKFRLPVGSRLEGVHLRSERAALPNGGREQLENVCALWPGSDPELQHEVIIVSAHYDHVGTRGEKIWNGADDNGSGTSGLLALADALAVHGPLRRSVMLIWVSAEEKGLWGSAAWAANPTLREGWKPVCDINIDMIGRNAPDELLITPTSKLEHYNGLTRLAEANSALEGFPVLGSADAYWSRSDHMEFAKLGIPVAFLFADVHDDYHQSTDTVDKINFDKLRRATRLVFRMLLGLQGDVLEL